MPTFVKTSQTLVAAAALALAAQAQAQITFYEHDGFQGRSFQTSRQQVANLERAAGFGDRASSVIVSNDRWEVCEDIRFEGRCRVLRPGQYPSLGALGLNDRVSSVRRLERSARVEDWRYSPAPVIGGDYRRRQGERLFEAPVTSVRAVVSQPEQRCWVERREVAPERRSANVPGAVVGAVIGGILGHQIGGGSGRDAATAGGVIGGAVLGSQVGRDRGEPTVQDVRRCETVRGQERPDYWDVTYRFRGQEHRVQLTEPPGETVTVNRSGEPRAS